MPLPVARFSVLPPVEENSATSESTDVDVLVEASPPPSGVELPCRRVVGQ
jgi:hypothetical protein